MGIDANRFGELLMSSGVLLNDDIWWVTFHSGYDFGYLLKLLTRKELPKSQTGFFDLIKIYFPIICDIKHLMRFCNSLHGGLNKLTGILEIERIGVCHQAGSDSLLTSHAFMKLKESYFNGNTEKYAGVLYGLGVEDGDKFWSSKEDKGPQEASSLDMPIWSDGNIDFYSNQGCAISCYQIKVFMYFLNYGFGKLRIRNFKVLYITEFKSFSYLYNEEHFITSLKNDVIIVENLPQKLKGARKRKEFPTFKPKKSASPDYYIKELLPELKKSKVIRLVIMDGGCLKSENLALGKQWKRMFASFVLMVDIFFVIGDECGIALKVIILLVLTVMKFSSNLRVVGIVGFPSEFDLLEAPWRKLEPIPLSRAF
ncbi:hypothetical protein L2E82_17123 [Cichorium intybus]|uniref:Uncharacterized protein n=1 Tax=Cichorium intybus TaxID=13427 RepID=A0ACB9F7F2_CICIN|nr:hypothetical protein L2E82_17123 [Cichorium intybus]